MFLFVSVVFAETPDKCSRVKIFVPDRATLDKIWSTGIDFEGASGKIGGYMEFVADSPSKEALLKDGLQYDIVIDDLAKYEGSRLTPGPVNALGFGYGTMGGFYTYAEVGTQLDSMRILYPNLITAKTSIGTTTEGRSMWMVRLKNDADVDDPSKPEILYTALHHAREPEGMMTLMYYMWWLVQNYGTNEEATYIMNTRQLYFVPVVNPDGYVYNQTTNPSGGGYWRENRRMNNASCYGVDLNRNYGNYSMWNSANGGSSTTTTCGQGTYRGPSPFSEPETQAIDAFMRTHTIKTALNYHTYGNYLIYPYGYSSSENGDSLIYRDWTYEMQFDNHYTNGTDQQTVNYSTRGNSDDYMYGDTSGGKTVTYTMTPEVGTSGFWPGTSEIFPLAIANLKQNKVLAYVGGSYPTMVKHTIQDEGNNGFIDRGENFSLSLDIKNRGLVAAQNVSVEVVSSDASVSFTNSPVLLSSLGAQVTTQAVLTGSVNGTATTGVPFKLYVTMTDPDGFVKRDTLSMFLGTPAAIFTDSASAGTGNWTTGSGWGTTATAHTPPFAFTDSPSGNYAPSANNSLTLNSQISLAAYTSVQLNFWAKWATEPSWDFATVELSTNNGSTWTTIRTKLSHSGSGRASSQTAGTWGFESYTPGLTWVEQDADLSSYAGSQIKLRFRVAADGGEQRDGFYVDDIRLYGWNPNFDTVAASTPTLMMPVDGLTGVARRPTLRWHSSVGAMVYRLQVSTDSLFGTMVFDDSTLTDTSKMIGPLSYGTTFYWRVSAKNNAGSSSFTDRWSFTVIIAPPAIPTLNYPANSATHVPVAFNLEWNPSSGAVNYILQVSQDSMFTSYLVNDSTIIDTSYALSGLSLDTKYFWRVKGMNAGGTSAFSDEWSFKTVGVPPSIPALVSPIDGADLQPSTLTLRWNEAAGFEHYHVQVASDSGCTVIVFEDSTLSTHQTTVTGLDNDTQYYWRVRASNEYGESDWSSIWSFTTGSFTVTMSMNSRWNLVSVPVTVPDYSMGALFASATSSAFAFEGSYATKETLVNGMGYWLKFGGSENVGIVGQYISSQEIPVVAGWNLIGSISDPINVNAVTSIPPGIVTSEFYKYNNGYSLTATLTPGYGYWVKVSQAGTLVLSSDLVHESTADRIRIVPSSDVPPPPPGEVNSENPVIPSAFSLEQNYPNPFNPVTIISYQLADIGTGHAVFVQLKVYNMLGVEVATLVNSMQEPGYKTVQFDASSLTSGVYTYKLTAGEFSATKKMLLMK